jgi:phenylglyoxylate dehydrogenase epsilon subunit
MQTKYLIIGSSHAGLNAADEIRTHDQQSPLTMISMENYLPYSPTILPYIVSGKTEEQNIYLRDESFFQENQITFLPGKKAIGINTSAAKVAFSDGSEIGYEKLLIATGAEPTIPPVPGLRDASYHVLRTMEDAQKLKEALETAKSAVIMGAGLVGLHAAESFSEKGLKVAVVELFPQVLPGYFDAEASELIQRVFAENGVTFYLNNPAVKVESIAGKSKVILKQGQELEGDILLVSTGVKTRTDFLESSGLEMDQGIIVDNFMHTSIENIWAAGDVAQADSFFSKGKVLNAILPDAFEQGKIAGMSMAEGTLIIQDFPELGEKDFSLIYRGGVPMNTFNFYGNRAFSVGMIGPENEEDYEIDKLVLPTGLVYQKMVFEDDYLIGFIGINVPLEPGIIMNIIRRKVNLREKKAEFALDPLNMSRRIMWSWRG